MIKLQQRKRQLDIFWLLMGGVASIVGLALLVPFADSLLWHEEKSRAFLVPAVLSLALGLGFGWLGRDHKRQINVWEGALFMVLVWPLLSVLGMMPYVLSGVLTSPVDAFFESVAAITTTGLSCLDYARSDMARSLVLWHSIMSWLGGLNFIIILSTVLPQVSGCFGLTLSRARAFFQPCLEQDGRVGASGLRCLHCADGAFVCALPAGRARPLRGPDAVDGDAVVERFG